MNYRRNLMGYFICKCDDMWTDSWTYGDWRQYVCKRPDGALQCARPSSIPSISFMMGVALLSMTAIAAALTIWAGVAIYWERAMVATVLAGALTSPMLLKRHRLMLSVGPKQYDGVRVFEHEPTP
jgi:hypothetical protein